MIDQPEDDVLYDVQWFINEDVISGAESRDVAYHNMNSTSLKVGHWAGNYSLNFNVMCFCFVNKFLQVSLEIIFNYDKKNCFPFQGFMFYHNEKCYIWEYHIAK